MDWYTFGSSYTAKKAVIGLLFFFCEKCFEPLFHQGLTAATQWIAAGAIRVCLDNLVVLQSGLYRHRNGFVPYAFLKRHQSGFRLIFNCGEKLTALYLR